MPPTAPATAPATQPAYLDHNQTYWEKGYDAPNVDHPVFRFYGKVLRPEFNLPQNHEPLLDFGCGQGAAVNFFAANGFDAHGVDISNTDLTAARFRYPHIRDRFQQCDPDPTRVETYGPDKPYRVITAIQVLYYFAKDDFALALRKLYDQLAPGGIFFATMMGEQNSEWFDNSQPTDDPWLRRVDFANSRISLSDYYMFFIRDEADMIERFDLFKPLHVGYYAAKFRSDEGDGFHYTFCGIKE